MKVFWLLLLTSLGYLIAYHTYGRYLAKRIFNLNPTHIVPSHSQADGQEYVASERGVMFGHHFTSIAGTGPIVGPAIGVIWGWVPAVLWIFFGSIFMGAVHDFAALVMSMRNQGQSLSELAARYVNSRVRLMFFLIVFLALLIVIAIFGLVIALIFSRFPASVVPLWTEIPIAIGLGYVVFRKGGSLSRWTAIAVILMYGSVLLGLVLPFQMPTLFGIPATGLWTLILLAYAFVASVTPVRLLLQPRDYLNAWQLYVALGAIVLGIVATASQIDFRIAAPAFVSDPVGAPDMWPFLFITIACGAVSGFHCLVCSGTSSKQINSEGDAQLVGYGAMMTEAALATIVVIAVTAGIALAYESSSGELLTGLAAWQAHYGSWAASAGLGSKMDAVVIGSANMMQSIGIPISLGVAIVGVFIASFAGTTLDSATRIQRYIIGEMLGRSRFRALSNKWTATTIAVVSAGALAFSSGADGKGALALWPMFGAVNQLLAGLALMIATVYLRGKHGPVYLITGVPCVFMLGMTLWAALLNQQHFYQAGQWLVFAINGIILLLAIAMTIETVLVFLNGRVGQVPLSQVKENVIP